MPTTTVCLEAGPFAAAEVAAAERGLRELKWPRIDWSQQRSDRGGSCIVYRGRFADGALAARLSQLNLPPASSGFRPCAAPP